MPVTISWLVHAGDEGHSDCNTSKANISYYITYILEWFGNWHLRISSLANKCAIAIFEYYRFYKVNKNTHY